MTSLTLVLAHAAAPAFNGLFYATAATIIPVFFLALAVQGRIYADLLQTARALARARQHPVHTGTADGRLPRSSRLQMATVNGLAWLAALLIPISGFFGEQAAIIALYWGMTTAAPGSSCSSQRYSCSLLWPWARW